MTPGRSGTKRIEKPRDKDRDFTALALAKAAYVLSVHDPRELPRPSVAEAAFAGRSNAGKSSAINTLTGRRRLAYVSKTPGRTQLINFFSVDGRAYLVDLPGYGYAGVPGEVRQHWGELVSEYIANRESLAGVVVVMDVRHPLTALDRQLIAWLREAGRPAHVLLTKADKLSKQAARTTLDRVRRELKGLWPESTAQLFSSLKNEGIAEAAQAITRLAARKNKAPAKGE